MKIIEGTGKILVFLSFWLIAPEILGEATLKRYLERGIRSLALLFSLFVALVAIFLIYQGIYPGNKTHGSHQNRGPSLFPIIVPIFDNYHKLIGKKYGTFERLQKIQEITEKADRCFEIVLIIAGVLIFAISLVISFWKKAVNEFLSRLAQNEKTRRLLLILGAWIFTLGSILDFIGSQF